MERVRALTTTSITNPPPRTPRRQRPRAALARKIVTILAVPKFAFHLDFAALIPLFQALKDEKRFARTTHQAFVFDTIGTESAS
ncbi:hypothetical protein RJ035_005545 [Blastomyces gilchristii]